MLVGDAAWSILPQRLQPRAGQQRSRRQPHAQGYLRAGGPRGAERKAPVIIDDLRAAKMNNAADLVEQTVRETLAYHTFPDRHRQKIHTNSLLERIMQEIRRRTSVVGAFRDG